MTDLEKVEQFHRLFRLPVVDKPKVPSDDRIKLRMKLISEESHELMDAMDDENLPNIIKEAADLLYVLNGMLLEFGLGECFEQAFDIVHQSNMSKLCYGKDDVRKSIEMYMKEKMVESYGEHIGDDVYILRRSDDDKVLKSISYKPAEKDIEKLIVEVSLESEYKEMTQPKTDKK
jgi:predicted HAD superfamily Cof-like phosphohydrolase